jgi:hypothetical protein
LFTRGSRRTSTGTKFPSNPAAHVENCRLSSLEIISDLIVVTRKLDAGMGHTGHAANAGLATRLGLLAYYEAIEKSAEAFNSLNFSINTWHLIGVMKTIYGIVERFSMFARMIDLTGGSGEPARAWRRFDVDFRASNRVSTVA